MNPNLTNFSFLYNKNGIEVYMNNNTQDLAFINSSYMGYSDFMQLDYDERINTIINKTIVDDAQLNLYDNIDNPSSCKLVKFDTDYLKFEAEINENNQIISFSIPYDKGWNAYIDGKKVEIQEVNISMLGITVDEGHHIISLRYKPKPILYGFIISVLTVVLLLMWYYRSSLKKIINKY